MTKHCASDQSGVRLRSDSLSVSQPTKHVYKDNHGAQSQDFWRACGRRTGNFGVLIAGLVFEVLGRPQLPVPYDLLDLCIFLLPVEAEWVPPSRIAQFPLLAPETRHLIVGERDVGLAVDTVRRVLPAPELLSRVEENPVNVARGVLQTNQQAPDACHELFGRFRALPPPELGAPPSKRGRRGGHLLIPRYILEVSHTHTTANLAPGYSPAALCKCSCSRRQFDPPSPLERHVGGHLSHCSSSPARTAPTFPSPLHPGGILTLLAAQREERPLQSRRTPLPPSTLKRPTSQKRKATSILVDWVTRRFRRLSSRHLPSTRS
jgi:hypothetical protein